MADSIKAVAHFLNGELLKGTVQDFSPMRLFFHLEPPTGGPPIRIQCKDLKAIYFVKDFDGLPERKDLRGFVNSPGETVHGRKTAVSFKDGEIVCGYSLTFAGDRAGFFVSPADQGGNNLRIFVLTAATRLVRSGPAADRLAQESLEKPEAA